jgi:high affinity Mn2+ porin
MSLFRAIVAMLLFQGAAYAQSAVATVTDASDPSSDSSQAAPATHPDPNNEFDRWNLFYQATSIGMTHPAFPAPYTGPLSLLPVAEHDVSLTTTLFFAARLEQNTVLVLNPEVAGGRGFSGVNGLANPPNGELPRVGKATPTPYVARAFIQHDFGFGHEKEHVERDENVLAGNRPMTRYSIYVGRFSITDYFDDNAYTHDPRTQFMSWALMYNGAWDYPADTRGYTWGIVHEFHTRNWSLRYGIVAMSSYANGPRFDHRLFRDHGQVGEIERRFSLRGRDGAIRALYYANRADMGNYGAALRLAAATGTTPDVTLTRQVGTLKYGVGISFNQEITSDVGVFTRLGWNDGKTESFEFTAMDRLASGGISVRGTRWKRPDDVVATAFIAGGLSRVHSEYLAAGGLDFLIGDGRLNYAPEMVWESYYSARLFPGFFASLGMQRVTNPAYNRDRGPVMIYLLRLHIALGLKPWQPQ